MAHLASEAFADIFNSDQLHSLQSPSFRRRYRKNLKRRLKPGLKREASEPIWILIRQSFDNLERDLQASGYQPDPRRIKSLAKPEAELYEELGTLAESNQIVNFFPFDELYKTVDPRLARRVRSELGEEGYPSYLSQTLLELIFSPPKDRRIRNDSALWKLLGIDPSSDYEPENFAKRLMAMLLGLAGLAPMRKFNGESLPTEELEELLRHLVRWHLPYIALGPYLWAKEPDRMDYRLADQGAEVDSRILLKIGLEVALDELPAAQRRAVDKALEVKATGKTMKQLCRGDRDYQAVRQNLHLARKRLKRALMA